MCGVVKDHIRARGMEDDRKDMQLLAPSWINFSILHTVAVALTITSCAAGKSANNPTIFSGQLQDQIKGLAQTPRVS